MKYQRSDGGRIAEGYISEQRDCSVRALAIAMQMSYTDSHAIHKSIGRKNGKGSCFFRYSVRNFEFDGKRFVHENRPHARASRYIAEHPHGTYVVGLSCHVFAVINGISYDFAETNRGLKNCPVEEVWHVVSIGQKQLPDKGLDKP